MLKPIGLRYHKKFMEAIRRSYTIVKRILPVSKNEARRFTALRWGMRRVSENRTPVFTPLRYVGLVVTVACGPFGCPVIGVGATFRL